MEDEIVDLIETIPASASDESATSSSETLLRELQYYEIRRVILSPKRWTSYKNTVPLSWNTVVFEKTSKEFIPKDKGGVYTFIIRPGVANHPDSSFLLYVGKAKSLQERFLSYFAEKKRVKGGRNHIKHMLRRWEGYIWFCYAPIDDSERIEEVEDDLISALVPAENKTFKGMLKEAMEAWGVI